MLNILAMLGGRFIVAGVLLAVAVPAAVLSTLVQLAGALGGAA